MSRSSSVIELRTTKSFLLGMACYFMGMGTSKFSLAALGSTESTSCPQSAGPYFACAWYVIAFICMIYYVYQYKMNDAQQRADNFKLTAWQTVFISLLILLTMFLVAMHINFAIKIQNSSEGETCIDEWNIRALQIGEGIGALLFMFTFAYYAVAGSADSYVNYDQSLASSVIPLPPMSFSQSSSPQYSSPLSSSPQAFSPQSAFGTQALQSQLPNPGQFMTGGIQTIPNMAYPQIRM